MWIFVEERLLQLVILAVSTTIALYVMNRAEKGITKPVRRLPSLDGIEEGVKRCVETGKSVFYTTALGGGGLRSAKGTAHMAGLSILGYVARLTARLGAKLIMVTPFAEIVPVAEDIVHQAYLVEGQGGLPPETIRFLSGYSHTFKMAYVGMITREQPGCNIVAGAVWSSDALQMTEPGRQLGAVQIGGADNMTALAMLSLTCDHVLIGEELYCAAAFCSDDPVQLNFIYGSDLIKMGILALILVGFVLNMMGMNVNGFFTI